MGIVRKKKRPMPLKMSRITDARFRRNISVASISSTFFPSTLTDASTPRTPRWRVPTTPCLAAALRLELGIREQVKGESRKGKDIKQEKKLGTVNKSLDTLDGEVRKMERRCWHERAKKKRVETWRNKVVPVRLRYVDGFPIRESLVENAPATIFVVEEEEEETEEQVPVASGGGGRQTGEKAKGEGKATLEVVEKRCIQCRVRNLRCSLASLTGDRGGMQGGSCVRCVRHGEEDECLVKATDADSPDWQFAKLGPLAPYDPPTSFYAKITTGGKVVLVNFEDEERKLRILEKWTDRADGVMVDAVAGGMIKVETSAFAPPRPQDETELRAKYPQEDRKHSG